MNRYTRVNLCLEFLDSISNWSDFVARELSKVKRLRPEAKAAGRLRKKVNKLIARIEKKRPE